MIRKWLVLVLLLALAPAADSYAAEPAYAKWGRMAMAEAQKCYAGELIDYRHLGAEQVSATDTQESFRFWMRQGGKEFGVTVSIRFETASERVDSVVCRRTGP
ncbi:MAG: DUF3889 domain-containing protein [Paenibacillaceae bacterium]|nr:DUF3889 domain-containing protein [Paenibacillaceae bacterium]